MLSAKYVFSHVWLKWPSPSLDSALLESKLEAATHSLLILLGGSLKAARLGARRGGARRSPEGQAIAREGFGDGFSLAKHILCESRNGG